MKPCSRFAVVLATAAVIVIGTVDVVDGFATTTGIKSKIGSAAGGRFVVSGGAAAGTTMTKQPLLPLTTTSLQLKKKFRSKSSSGGSGGSSNTAADTAPPLKRHPPRKICLMVEPTPFTHVSGYANRFQEMLKYLRRAGDNVDILTVDSQTPAKQLPSKWLDYPVHHTLGFTFPLYNQISLSMDLPEMKGARILESNPRPDLIHVTSPGFMVLSALFYARVTCTPLVASYHTHLPSYGKNYMGFVPGIDRICWEVLRWVHSRVDLTLVTSPQMQKELTDNGIPRVEVWRKGIDTDRFHPKFCSDTMRNKMTAGNPDDFTMVYVGRLGAEKRLKDIREVLERMPGSRLALVGKGPQQEELKEWFRGTPTVFLGQLSGDELSEAFASADAFCMPSDSETLGFVVLESMASGVPVVGAAAGGIPDLIDDGRTGYLVEPGNTDQFVDRLSKLRTDEKVRKSMGRSARQEAERWGWEAATSYLRNVQYEKALINFHSRAFGGFGRPGTVSVWRLMGWRIRTVWKRLTGQVISTPTGFFSRLWRRIVFGRRRRRSRRFRRQRDRAAIKQDEQQQQQPRTA